jgi:hypothetical protein
MNMQMSSEESVYDLPNKRIRPTIDRRHITLLNSIVETLKVLHKCTRGQLGQRRRVCKERNREQKTNEEE